MKFFGNTGKLYQQFILSHDKQQYNCVVELRVVSTPINDITTTLKNISETGDKDIKYQQEYVWNNTTFFSHQFNKHHNYRRGILWGRG